MLKNYIKNLNIIITALSWSTLVSANEVDLNNNHKVPVRFIYAQGFSSCGAEYYEPVAKFESLVAEGNENQSEYEYIADYYHYCYDFGFFSHRKDPKARLKLAHFRSLDDGRPVYKEIDILQSADLLVDSLTREARELQSKGYKMPMQIYIAGHSYGAWTVMRIAQKMLNNELLKVNALLTLDPISVVNCPSPKFISRSFIGTFGPRRWTQGCLEAPKDLEHMVPDLVKLTDFQWANIYERSMPYVRSGSMRGAPFNIELTWNAYYDYWTGHLSIIRDPRVWPVLFNRVAANLNESRL